VELTGRMSSVLKPIQSLMTGSSASTLLAAVCATRSGLISLKIRFVMACRMNRRTFTSSSPTVLEICS
jgi:hypothetical protein